jgi:nicotine blue oxidoreductase
MARWRTVVTVAEEIAGLVLAAGGGRRFGKPKALAEWAGRTLLDHAVETLRHGGCDPVYAVIGAAAHQLPAATSTAFVPVINYQWSNGMGSSLRAGLTALPAATPAVVVMLVDQPAVRPEAISRVRAAHAAGSRVAIATYGGERAHPVLFDRSTWSELTEAAVGDVGARSFLAAHPDLIVEVDCTGAGHARDIDTVDDWVAMTSSMRGGDHG